MTVSQLTREVITTHLSDGPKRRLLGAKAGRSGASDTARRIEEILTREVPAREVAEREGSR
ncbi:MAG: hypothetical protein M3323_15960 [Actinomycetota bacterium]|nr:hypothetical protein [Actinomycetota bacterium]